VLNGQPTRVASPAPYLSILVRRPKPAGRRADWSRQAPGQTPTLQRSRTPTRACAADACKSVSRSSHAKGLRRRACTTSGKVATEFQSDSSRTDSPVRILHAQPGSRVSGPFATAGEPPGPYSAFQRSGGRKPIASSEYRHSLHEAGVRCGFPDKIERRRVESDIRDGILDRQPKEVRMRVDRVVWKVFDAEFEHAGSFGATMARACGAPTRDE
jgi:hypothetical protein